MGDGELKKWAVPSPQRDDDWRSEFKHDIDEVVYRHAFRKLAQKTQVIARPTNDTFRTRLTHTLEVSQIADNFGQRLGLNRDLLRAISYAHDLGHPPFAHVGEVTLRRLLHVSVERAAKPIPIPKEDLKSLLGLITFRHAENSRRILQRKTKGVSHWTQVGVMGHGWSPWKKANDSGSKDNLEKLLKAQLHKKEFLECYEAQAVALSDQLAGLNSDIEDLEGLADAPGDAHAWITNNMKIYLDKKKITGIPKKKIEEISSILLGHRKHRIGNSIDSIVENSMTILKAHASSWKDSKKYPLAPSAEYALGLCLLEAATREIVYTYDEIRVRDSYAETAISQMFHIFLSAAVNDKHANSPLPPDIMDDFADWQTEYLSEVQSENPEGDSFSYARIQEACNDYPGLWERVAPALTTVDYISELTDRFVVDDVFEGHPLQGVLRVYFGGGYVRG